MRYPPIARDLLFFVVGSIAGMFVTYRIVKPPVDSIVDQLKACRQKLPQPAGAPVPLPRLDDLRDPDNAQTVMGNSNTVEGPALDTWVVGAGIYLKNPRHVFAVSCIPATKESAVFVYYRGPKDPGVTPLSKICDGKQWE